MSTTTPLITADEIFPAMESLMLSATSHVYLSLHIFSSRTKTRTREAHALQIANWGELIAHTLQRGVRVRLLLNDFDPIGGPQLHASVWERMRFLDEAIAPLDKETRGRLKLLVALPGGQTGSVLRTLVWPKVRAMEKELGDEFARLDRALPPGLVRPSKADVPWWPPRRNFTQTLHQKFMISDNRAAIIGGLDIDERRFDDLAHRRKGEQTWHDVSVRTGETEARELARHFLFSWRMVARHGTSFAANYKRQSPTCALQFVMPRSALGRPERRRYAQPVEPIAVTAGQPRRSMMRFGPSRFLRGLEMAHFDLIKRARKFIYIETQFFRSTAIRDALSAQMGTEPDLHVIALLPAAPDAVAYDADFGPVHRYGEWLQMRALLRLKTLHGNRFGAFCLTNERDRREHHERDALHGKAMVYIHSKVMIADDAHAIVSSGNLNGRSMEWDFEAGVYSHDADFARDLREQLWHAHLGEAAAGCAPADDPAACIACWENAAEIRRQKGEDTAKPGVVPFPISKIKRFSKRHLFIPQQMV